MAEKLPALYDPTRFQGLDRHRQSCEVLPAFAAAAFSRVEAQATGWRPEGDPAR
ncbi:MAG: hypothetical protein AAFR17_18215 [Pseudomonadota bacterium]